MSNNVFDLKTGKLVDNSTVQKSMLDFHQDFRFISHRGEVMARANSLDGLLLEAVLLDAEGVTGRMQQACTYHQSGVGAQQVWLDVLEDS
jgi:hypothetical protein